MVLLEEILMVQDFKCNLNKIAFVRNYLDFLFMYKSCGVQSNWLLWKLVDLSCAFILETDFICFTDFLLRIIYGLNFSGVTFMDPIGLQTNFSLLVLYTYLSKLLYFLYFIHMSFYIKAFPLPVDSLNHSAYHFFPGSYIDQQVSLYLIRSKEENKKTIMAEQQKKTMAEEPYIEPNQLS